MHGNMNQTLPIPANNTDIMYVQLAREIAVDHFPLQEILDRYKLSQEDWDRIKEHPRFRQLLNDEIVAWQSAINTHDRVKLKSAALIEMWLEEANARMWDKTEALPAKTEVAKLVARLAGMGGNPTMTNEGGGDRLSITINLGEDKKLKFENNIPKTIEGSVNDK